MTFCIASGTLHSVPLNTYWSYTFGLQDHGRNAVPQAGVGRVEPKGTQDPRGGEHSSFPCLLALLAMEGTFQDFITFLQHIYDTFTVLL
jgi:hypothetical protein